MFNVILNVPGVRKVKDLQLRACNGSLPQQTGWKFKLPKNYIPDFTMGCSGFRFSKNGRPVTVDTAKYQTLLDINFNNTGKILYSEAYPNLDSAIPGGIYRSDPKRLLFYSKRFSPRIWYWRRRFARFSACRQKGTGTATESLPVVL